MLKRAYEWLRIVNPEPSSELVRARQAAGTQIATAISDESDCSLGMACAMGVVSGFESFASDSATVKQLVDLIRGQDSAFPGDLGENALELRVVAALALGEVVQDVDRGDALLAAVLLSGLGSRPPTRKKHLDRMITEILDLTCRSLSSRADRHRRVPSKAVRLPSTAPEALDKAWTTIVDLHEQLTLVQQQARIDREEINVLWWVFGASSTHAAKPLAALPAGAAALCCGAELGSLSLLPSIASVEALAERAYLASRSAPDQAALAVSALASSWTDTLPRVLVPDDEAASLSQEFPSLFPLSWLCARLIDSGGATGWKAEFKRKTGISASHSELPAHWATQALRERQAQRLHRVANCR